LVPVVFVAGIRRRDAQLAVVRIGEPPEGIATLKVSKERDRGDVTFAMERGCDAV
jgi:hypothetical protein